MLRTLAMATTRIDYIVVDKELAGWCQSTAVVRDSDLAHEDHCPLVLKLGDLVQH